MPKSRDTRQMATVDLLARDSIALADNSSRAILGIAGGPGAGKSTLVDMLVARIRAIKGDDWVAHIPMDGFHLADAQLDRIGARGRKGAPDTFDSADYAHLLVRVKRDVDHPVYVPGFDPHWNSRSPRRSSCCLRLVWSSPRATTCCSTTRTGRTRAEPWPPCGSS